MPNGNLDLNMVCRYTLLRYCDGIGREIENKEGERYLMKKDDRFCDESQTPE
jgi:hypothetical protein